MQEFLKLYFTFLEFPHLIFLQYIFTGMEHPVEPASHGNSKMRLSSAYIRTKESAIGKLRREVRFEPPKAAYRRVHKDQGGIVNASSSSDLPRNVEQQNIFDVVAQNKKLR